MTKRCFGQKRYPENQDSEASFEATETNADSPEAINSWVKRIAPLSESDSDSEKGSDMDDVE